jgi:hypothetical protein
LSEYASAHFQAFYAVLCKTSLIFYFHKTVLSRNQNCIYQRYFKNQNDRNYRFDSRAYRIELLTSTSQILNPKSPISNPRIPESSNHLILKSTNQHSCLKLFIFFTGGAASRAQSSPLIFLHPFIFSHVKKPLLPDRRQAGEAATYPLQSCLQLFIFFTGCLKPHTLSSFY